MLLPIKKTCPLRIPYGIHLFKVMKLIIIIDTFTSLIGIPFWLNFAVQSSRRHYF